MKSHVIFFVVAFFSTSTSSSGGELDIYPPANVPAEWRRLAADYQTKIDALKEDRKSRGEKVQTTRDKLNAIDFAKVSEQAKQDMEEGLDDLAEALKDAATEYFEGPGKRDNVIDAGTTIITEALPAFKQVYEAQFAEVDLQFEMDELQTDLNRYEREIRDLDRKIDDLQRNADLSKTVAEAYEQQIKQTNEKTKEVVFKVVESARAATKTAQEKHDTVPPGWQECTCPDAHTNYGRVIKGHRYHATGPMCP
ncbi:hypothetical protein [Rhizobium leguminosarum]